MPNIYVNRLSVVGDPFILSDLIDQGIGCYPHSPIAGYQTQEEYDKEVEESNKEVPFCFNQFIPLDEDLKKLSYSEFGYYNQRDKWGLKWGGFNYKDSCISEDENCVTYQFSTANGDCSFFVTQVSKMFPSLIFYVSVGGEDSCRDRYTIQNGFLFDHEINCEPDFKYDMGNPEEEELALKEYNDWEQEMISTHDEWVNSLITE